jgi:hypothetical protein
MLKGPFKRFCGEGVHPDGGSHHDEETPLWHAVMKACSDGGSRVRISKKCWLSSFTFLKVLLRLSSHRLVREKSVAITFVLGF